MGFCETAVGLTKAEISAHMNVKIHICGNQAFRVRLTLTMVLIMLALPSQNVQTRKNEHDFMASNRFEFGKEVLP